MTSDKTVICLKRLAKREYLDLEDLKLLVPDALSLETISGLKQKYG